MSFLPLLSFPRKRESQRDKLQQEIQNKKWITHSRVTGRDDKFNNPDKIFISGLKNLEIQNPKL